MERKSAEQKENTKQLIESFKQKEQALLYKDIKLNEDFEFAKQIIYTLHEEIERKTVEQKKNTEQLLYKLHRTNQDFEFAKQIIYTLHDEIERKSVEQKAYTEQLVESFKQKEQALLHENKQLFEDELRSKDVVIAQLEDKIEKQVRY